MFLNSRSGSLGLASLLHESSTEEALVRETCNTSGVNRRTILLAAAGAAPLLALTGGQAQAKIAQTAVHYQATLLRRPQRLQVGRWRDRPDRMVRVVGEEGPCLSKALSAVSAWIPSRCALRLETDGRHRVRMA
jgi:hypothetical protein